MMSELKDLLCSKGVGKVTHKPLHITRKDVNVYRRTGPSKKKPILFDPTTEDGPVKHYTREEIEEYEKNLNKN